MTCIHRLLAESNMLKIKSRSLGRSLISEELVAQADLFWISSTLQKARCMPPAPACHGSMDTNRFLELGGNPAKLVSSKFRKTVPQKIRWREAKEDSAVHLCLLHAVYTHKHTHTYTIQQDRTTEKTVLTTTKLRKTD